MASFEELADFKSHLHPNVRHFLSITQVRGNSLRLNQNDTEVF